MRFGSPPSYKHIETEADRALIVRLREAVAPILANNLLPHFTDHSVSHSDNLTRLIDELLEPIQAGSNRLNLKELIVLYSSCYLHDIGMHYEDAGKTTAISQLGLPQMWAELSEDTRRNLLREHHNRISAEMVFRSVRAEQPIVGLQLTPDYDPSRIACLCEAHTLDADSERYKMLKMDGPHLRMALLSGLLRIADILDESRRRATREKARTLMLDIVAQTHWWRHYYTEDVLVNEHEKTVSICFDFPESRSEEYSNIVPLLQMPWIEAEFGKHQAVFHRYGLGWTLKFQTGEKPYSDTEVMPDTVLGEMLKQLNRRRQTEEEERRLIVVQQFSAAKPHIDRQLENLINRKEALLPSDYYQELTSICIDLSELGGRRDAWMKLWSAFDESRATLDAVQRLDMGLKVARLMINDNAAELAIRVIQEISDVAEALTPQHGNKFIYWQLRAECTGKICAYDKALEASEQALLLAPDETSKSELQAQLSEWHFLQGNFDAAISTAQDTKA